MARPKMKVYAVRVGRQPGIYNTWKECQEQTDRYPGARFQSFTCMEDAQAFVYGVEVTKCRPSKPTVLEKRKLPQSPTPVPPAKRVPPMKDTIVDRVKRVSAIPIHHDPELESCMAAWEARQIDAYVDVYTDGSSLGNGSGSSSAGYWVFWVNERFHYLNQACRLAGPVQTNNRAELTAILTAIRLNPEPSRPLRIWTDSQYAIKCINVWMPRWRSNNWKRGYDAEVSNKDLLQEIDKAIGKCEIRPTLEYVKGHGGIFGNEMADKLANEGARLPVLP